MKAGRSVALSLALLACAAASAGSQEARGDVAPPAAATQAQDQPLVPVVQPGQPHGKKPARAAAPNKPLPRRRSVQQIIATVPPPPLAGPSYGPVLAPRAPAPVVSPAPGTSPVYPPPPAAINGCQGSVCTDAAGTNYNLGVGNAGVSSQGRLCSRNGQTVQCF